MLKPHPQPRLSHRLLLGLMGLMGCKRLSSPHLQECPEVFSIYIWVKFSLNLLQRSLPCRRGWSAAPDHGAVPGSLCGTPTANGRAGLVPGASPASPQF